MVRGPDGREDFTHLRWTTPEGRHVLQAEPWSCSASWPDGKFAAVQRTGLNEVKIIIGSADHTWHKTAQMSAEECEAWDRSLADYGLHIECAA